MVSRQLMERFEGWRRRGRALVLATVIATEGSTYRKTGAQMLLDPEGRFEGLLSGGCLESDLLEHGRAVLADGEARRVTYDFSDPALDGLWGLGLGCLGVTTILLQALAPEDDFLPFSAVVALARSSASGCQLLVTASQRPDVPVGSALVCSAAFRRASGLPSEVAGSLAAAAASRSSEAGPWTTELEGLEVLALPVAPPLRVLLCGGGPDALPVHELVLRQGWECVVFDHRPAYTARLREQGVADARDLEPGAPLPAHELSRAAAAVVMSHHLASDRHYLEQLAASAVPYVGLLGPSARGRHLLAEIGPLARRLEGRLRSPIGLDLGGEGPEAIALAVVAEVQAAVAGRAGGPLSGAVTGIGGIPG